MRWLVRILSALVMLVLVVLGLVFLIPSEKVAGLAAAEFEKISGRTLVLEGAVRPSVWPQLGVKTGPVTISNAEWSTEGPMLSADALSIGLDMKALIGGDVKITTIEAEAPRIVLERAADGRVNWDFTSEASTPSSAAQGAGTPFTLDRGLVTDGTVIFVDHLAGSRTELTGIGAEVKIPSFTGAAGVDLKARMNGQALALAGTVGAFASFLEGKVVPVSLAGTVGGSEFDFDGRLGTAPLAADGQLEANVSDLAAVFGLLGQAAPALPEGFGRRSITAAGKVTYAPEGSVHLREGAVVLDGNRFVASGDLFLSGERPKLNAQLTAGALDFSALGGDGGGGASGGGWSDARIDASGLGALDAEVALVADSIALGGMQLGKTRVLVTMDRGRAVFDIREMRAYDGLITGQFVMNGRSGLSVGGDLTVAAVAVQALLRDLADYERLVGTGDLRVKFLGSGGSMAAIMNSLAGDGRVSFGKGEILGLDLVGMLRTLDTSYVGPGSKTIFDSIAGTFTIKDGVLRNDDLAFVAPLVQATGKGNIGIGKRTLDYRVIPTALQKEDGTGGVKVPLMITGTWDKPRFGLDMGALADEKIEIERKRLEEKAAAELAKKAEQQLGIVTQEGESLEDAAKRAAGEAGLKALNKLLGGN